MTHDHFVDELRQILGAPPGALVMTAELAAYPGWDSMGKMAALTLIDSDLGVPVPPGLLQNWKTVGDVVAFVGSHLS